MQAVNRYRSSLQLDQLEKIFGSRPSKLLFEGCPLNYNPSKSLALFSCPQFAHFKILENWLPVASRTEVPKEHAGNGDGTVGEKSA